MNNAGIFIPQKVLEDEELSPPKKIILSVIIAECHHQWEKLCFYSNAEIARQTGINKGSVRLHLKAMQDAGYIIVNGIGLDRVIKVLK